MSATTISRIKRDERLLAVTTDKAVPQPPVGHDERGKLEDEGRAEQANEELARGPRSGVVGECGCARGY